MSTLLDHLTNLFPQAKKTTVRDLVAHKRVLINGALAKSLKQPLAESDRVEILDAAEAASKSTYLAEGLRLLHFDADIILVDKPVGLLTSTDSQETRPTVWRILQTWFRRQNNKNQVHLIHRLDRDASGLLVFARTWPAYASLKKQFFEHTITRRYDVIVHNIPKKNDARLENLLLEDDTGTVHTTQDIKTGKLAILDYVLIQSNKSRRLAHLRCTLFTGRKHQIRVQLRAANHPVCGDPIYGKENEPPHRLALHAAHLSFEHPRTSRKVTFDSPMPPTFARLVT